jgi:hypothetical protein
VALKQEIAKRVHKILYGKYIPSPFLDAKIGFIFDSSKEKRRKVHL